MRLQTLGIFFALLGLTLASTASYEGFKIYRIYSRTQKENALLRKLESHPDMDFLSKINKVGKPVSVMVAPKSQNRLEHVLESNKVEFEVKIDDVGKVAPKKVLRSGGITFDKYLRHEEMNAYLDQLAEDYPDIATVETIGQSYEGRDMNVIRITSGSGDSKPIIFIDAGVHALEWIAPAVALYIINQLVENPENSDLISDVEWIILPSLNPDGYAYTWDVDYVWRKTRSPGVECFGVDGNRNFDFHWKEFVDGVAVSTDECSHQFIGNEPFSEVEVRNFRDFFNKTENIEAYLSLHSFGQYILYPWGFTEVGPENSDELQELGNAMNDAISAVRGTNYTVGETTTILYPASGASQDWVMGVAGVPIVFSMELPEGGFYGFDPPESEIQGIVEETFEGFKVFGRYIAQRNK